MTRDQAIAFLGKTDTIMLEDGFRYFDTTKGALAAHELRKIADALDLINQPWEEEVHRYFNDLLGEHGRPIKA